MISFREKVVQAELMTIFPLDAELVDSLLESTSYLVTDSLISELQEISGYPIQNELIALTNNSSSNNSSIVTIRASSLRGVEIPPIIKVGSMMIAQEDEDDINGSYRLQSIKIGDQSRACILESTVFGIHDWSVSFETGDDVDLKGLDRKEKKTTGTVFCTSCTFEYATALDEAFDLLYWGWGYGGLWDMDLENSLLELLVAVSDDLEAAIRSWQPMMAMMGGAAQETDKLLETVTKDVMLALRDHSPYAIGTHMYI